MTITRTSQKCVDRYVRRLSTMLRRAQRLGLIGRHAGQVWTNRCLSYIRRRLCKRIHLPHKRRRHVDMCWICFSGTGVDKDGDVRAASSQSVVYGLAIPRNNYKMGREQWSLQQLQSLPYVFSRDARNTNPNPHLALQLSSNQMLLHLQQLVPPFLVVCN